MRTDRQGQIAGGWTNRLNKLNEHLCEWTRGVHDRMND